MIKCHSPEQVPKSFWLFSKCPTPLGSTRFAALKPRRGLRRQVACRSLAGASTLVRGLTAPRACLLWGRSSWQSRGPPHPKEARGCQQQFSERREPMQNPQWRSEPPGLKSHLTALRVPTLECNARKNIPSCCNCTKVN